MIELDVSLPLPRFPLRVACRLEAPVTAILGPSGAGKTTLLETIAGLRPPARGRVAVDGVRLLDTGARIALAPEERRVGYVPQDAGLFPHLTALQNVRFGARGAVDEVIDALELRSFLERHPAQLSGGERQRVALARALATRPRVLLLDEPLAALDVTLRERLLPWLLRVQRGFGVPLLHVTHDVGEALALGGDALLLRDGAVEAFGPVETLLRLKAVRADSDHGLENVFVARVDAHDPAAGTTRVVIEETTVALSIPLAARDVGARVTIALRAEDVLVARGTLPVISARNVLDATVERVDGEGGDVVVRCVVAGCPRPWVVLLTQSAVGSLALVPGTAVLLAVKSHSVRLL
jgi:molybdate transport system ATP-binding protein